MLPEINLLPPSRNHLTSFSSFIYFFISVSGLTTIVGKYGETVEVPCNKGDIKVEDIMIAKWKYVSIFLRI